jgi:seryl-tRNA(Sec) selenium transferase
VCHTVALSFTLKKYLKAKEELWKLKYFTMQKCNLQQNHLQETKILQDHIITLYNYFQVSTQAKISSFKSPHIKIDLLLLPQGQNPLSYYTL